MDNNRLVDAVDLIIAHRDSSNGSNGGFTVSTKVCVETSSYRAEYSETAGNFKVLRVKQG